MTDQQPTEFDLATPEPVEATRTTPDETPDIVTPTPAAWATLMTTGYVRWTDPATGIEYTAELP